MTYDQWKTRSPDDEWGRYLCGGQGHDCGNTVSIPGDLCEECVEAAVEDEALMDFYQWEPVTLLGTLLGRIVT